MQDLFLGSGQAVGSASDSSNIMGAVSVAWGNSFTSSGSIFVFLFSLPALLILYAKSELHKFKQDPLVNIKNNHSELAFFSISSTRDI